MPRLREFDPQLALDRAMRTFWRKGYEGTSVGDLVEATGVNRSGIYDQFESKRGLFLAALDHYQRSVTSRAVAPLERQDAGLETLRHFLRSLVDISASPAGRIGCLMASGASQLAPDDRIVAEELAQFRANLRRAFRNALARARTGGELPADFDIDRSADFLVAILHSVAVLARSQASRSMISNVVEVAISTLN